MLKNDFPDILRAVRLNHAGNTIEERYEQLYQNEHALGQVFGAFSMLAVFLACLGLFGLAAFTVERRTKEIGVRKVLGATATNVITLLSKDFVKLVLIANLAAWPLAWFAMNKWLQNFACRAEAAWWVFVLVPLCRTLLIALLTVSTHAIKAALANPVEALRYE